LKRAKNGFQKRTQWYNHQYPMTSGKKPSDSPATADLTAPIDLCAGPLSLLYEKGYIRSLRLGGVEIVRRVYAAVRDEFWNTVAGSIEDLSVQRTASSFLITYNSRHRRGAIDFLWRAEITGKASGEIAFSLRGIALTRFKRNRIGLCVLHPLNISKGNPCRVETIDGLTVESVFPAAIAPYQLFINLRALSCPIASGLDATLRFEGDVFETEDQRNWTDATYKTYSTPLSLPLPVTLEKGTMINQKVTISIDKPTAPIIHVPYSLQIDFSGPSASRRVPEIGATENPGDAIGPGMVGRLKPLNLSYARVDCSFARDDVPMRLEHAAAVSAALGCPIELALHFAADPHTEAAFLADGYAKTPFPVRRFLVFHDSERSVAADTVASVNYLLREISSSAAIAGGTDRYFVEINRRRPPMEMLDAISFAATPQVHTFDTIAIMENLPGIQEALRAAASFSSGKPVIISPLTLRPRIDPMAPQKDGGPDSRQPTLFAAAWLAGALAWCASGNAAAVTLGDLRGPGGFLSPDGDPYPLCVPLAWIGRTTGAQASFHSGSDPSQIIGLKCHEGNRVQMIVINLSNRVSKVILRGLPAPCRLTLLDDASWQQVRETADPVNGLQEIIAHVKNGSLTIELGPYAAARIIEE
jgi:hypothetical protein